MNLQIISLRLSEIKVDFSLSSRMAFSDLSWIMQRMSPLRDPAKAVLHNPDLHLPVPDRGRCSSYFKVIFSGQIDLTFSLAPSCPQKHRIPIPQNQVPICLSFRINWLWIAGLRRFEEVMFSLLVLLFWKALPNLDLDFGAEFDITNWDEWRRKCEFCFLGRGIRQISTCSLFSKSHLSFARLTRFP